LVIDYGAAQEEDKRVFFIVLAIRIYLLIDGVFNFLRFYFEKNIELGKDKK
jgi:hypothetical protein